MQDSMIPQYLQCPHGLDRELDFCEPCFDAKHEKYRGANREYCHCPECEAWKVDQVKQELNPKQRRALIHRNRDMANKHGLADDRGQLCDDHLGAAWQLSSMFLEVAARAVSSQLVVNTRISDYVLHQSRY